MIFWSCGFAIVVRLQKKLPIITDIKVIFLDSCSKVLFEI